MSLRSLMANAPRGNLRRRVHILTAAVAAVFALAVPAATAGTSVSPVGPSGDTSVKSITIVSGGAVDRVTLSLTFDKGISQVEATKLRSSLAGSMVPSYGVDFWCWGSMDVPDGNGTFSIQYNCGSPRTLPWGYQISAAVQAIIVSPVTEAGLRWWRNSYFAGQNSNHTVPASYILHGTMNPVWATDEVSYQDYMTFLHDVGGGGTGSISFAGGVNLQN